MLSLAIHVRGCVMQLVAAHHAMEHNLLGTYPEGERPSGRKH